MAVSNSYDFAVTRNQIIKDALLLIGAIPASGDPSATVQANAARMLNMMVKGWHTMHNLWRYTDITFTTDGSASYTIGPSGDVDTQRPLRITMARRVDSSNYEIPVRVLSLQEYKEQPLKAATGDAVYVAYDPQTTLGVLYVWPCMTGKDLIVTAQRPLMDFDEDSNNPDFPIEWAECLVYNLALRLAPQFGRPIPPEVSGLAVSLLENLKAFDAEPTSIFFQPGKY